MEEKCKKITNMIKEHKNKQNATQRSGAGDSMAVTDVAKTRMEEELKALVENQQASEKRYKQQTGKLDVQLKQLQHELQILNIKLKEKDQEVKLNDLKIKELRKQVPNNKLRPLGEAGRKANQSVDSSGRGELS